MTGIYYRVKRDDKWCNVEIEHLSKEELVDLFKDADNDLLIRIIDALCGNLRMEEEESIPHKCYSCPNREDSKCVIFDAPICDKTLITCLEHDLYNWNEDLYKLRKENEKLRNKLANHKVVFELLKKKHWEQEYEIGGMALEFVPIKLEENPDEYELLLEAMWDE